MRSPLHQEMFPILSQQETMPGVFLLEIESPGLAAESRPGQFVMVGCDSGYGRLLRRPISIHRANEKTIALLYAVIGTGTEWLSRRKPGDKVDILGPLGNGFSSDTSPLQTSVPSPSRGEGQGEGKKISVAKNRLLVAGGLGIAPLIFLAQSNLEKGYQVKLLAGAATTGQLYPESLLPQGLETITATEDGSRGFKGLVTSLLDNHIDWADQVFACGPVPMYRTMTAYLKDKPTQVSLEVRMGCGLGFCYACTIRTKQGLKQVCKDGPVFDLQDVIWDELQ